MRIKTISTTSLALLFTVLLVSCGEKRIEGEAGADSLPRASVFASEIESWHRERVASLTREDGWLSLAGLFWLQEGENTFGSAGSNDLVFPEGKAPERMGSFRLVDGEVTLVLAEGVKVRLGEEEQWGGTLRLESDAHGSTTLVEWGPLLFHAIRRGERVGIRLKDREHPHLESFAGIERFPVEEAWKVKARFEPYEPPKGIPVPNVLGTVSETPSPGAVVFQKGGTSYRLEALAGGEGRLFLIFGDETNRDETYGGGRYLYAETGDETGTLTVDFNKAVNPPCAFTPYATCPLPPPQNKLAVRIEAGEKRYLGGPEH